MLLYSLCLFLLSVVTRKTSAYISNCSGISKIYAENGKQIIFTSGLWKQVIFPKQKNFKVLKKLGQWNILTCLFVIKYL